MLLPDKTGIRCDFCGKTYRQGFKYYSIDCRLIHVTNNVMPKLEYTSTVDKSFDACEDCVEKTKQEVIANYKPTKAMPGRIYPKGIYCDLTRAHLIGTYKFYHLTYALVSVKIGNGGHTNYDERSFELWISTAKFDEMVETCKKIDSNKEALIWSQSNG